MAKYSPGTAKNEVLYKIIIADESPSTRRAAQLAFPESEFQLLPFEDGLELLKAVPDIRPDAFLLGLSLSGRDGYDVALVLRRRPETRRTPIFFLRGTFESLDADKTNAVEHEGVIVTPFDSAKLVSLVREAIERRTTPVSLPEDPVWESFEDPAPSSNPSSVRRNLSGDSMRTGLPGTSFETDSPRDSGISVPSNRIREWIKAEVYELERELEKRIRARLLAECKDILARKVEPGTK